MSLLVAALDYLTGPYFSFTIFYLVPIVLVTWLVGKWAGAFLTLPSAIEWFVADRLARPQGQHPLIPYWNGVVEWGFFLIVAFTLSAWKGTFERERKMARMDPLTTVANIRSFAESAWSEIQRARRYGHPFTMAYLDLDNFKAVNDHFGHHTGDELLRVVAATMKNSVRANDLIARVGGDEFALLLPETGYEPARVVLDKIQKNLEEVMRMDSWPVTMSIGAVTFVRPADSVDAMIKAADDLMYSAKESGKNRIRHEAWNGK